ncbi:probable 3-hydroxyisobutyrate dehydrogenase-like 3, mitochondrial, partial [Asparagus officinalis]|uniref:probable 3-hydroxyisobutyrate dehydrogenase-like 3, mitochondrial n=1 Tax=Asparagus officinalis TaxID=4686 RepID=UPI00098E54AB
ILNRHLHFQYTRSRNCHAVDAPVSGGDIGARDGTLAIFAGAHEESIIQRLSPLFNILGKVTYMGPPGSGQNAKIANQIAISGSIVGLSEALLFAKTAGLDEKGFLDAIREGAAGSKATDLFGERIINRELGPGGFAEYLVKDLGMALDGAELALPGTALFQQLYLGMVANGDGKLGSHAVVTALERINGKNRRKLQD